ncbi:hypothetical protein [Pseudomonas rubra]|uniref:Uncharacterized protein n=1 Tax=Pseudomonas rubra TaxID=2942627 RepID=A0ABT5P9W2_9PSED|nr:hypothetical protein [Pseudomonas rubra]MDD1015086.1 hypothetical protein [Pseudomonas rubra]MDD1038579.1 hypothetical protein [Pseudomonas rubra]MDD1154729.1 hypothetical protein [Pseudomonas rubra]
MDENNKARLRLYQPGDSVVLYGCFAAEYGVMETQSGIVRSIDWCSCQLKLYFACDDECRYIPFASITAVPSPARRRAGAVDQG